MTRDFNKQRRDDTRPSFRDRSSNNHGEERSPRPGGRPRLNRETVDRAWEAGGQHAHADYRPRTNNGQPPRNNWRNQQPSEYSSSQNGRGGNKPYNNNNRQENYRDNSRRSERTPDDSYGPRSPRPRSFGPGNTGRQHYDTPRPGERRNYGERTNGPGTRPDYRRDTNRPGSRDDQFRSQDRGRDNRRPDFNRNERPYSNERRGPGGQQDQRPGSDTRNPRWQSRTWTRQASPEERQEHSSRAPYNAQFEGDYERFNSKESRPGQRDISHHNSPPDGKAFRGRQQRENEVGDSAQDRHVTRLPDGRVIKGPRPVQRQEARFWTEIADDAKDLVGQVQATPEDAEVAQNVEVSEEIPGTENKPSPKPRTRSASATVRSRKTGAAKEKTKSPRPSKRGFKWPAQ